MSAFTDRVQDFFAAAVGLHRGVFSDRVNAVLEVIPKATPDEAAWTVGPLVEMVARSSAPRLSVLGLLGQLLCRGVDFWGVVPHHLAGIRHHLALAAQAERAIRPLLPPGKKMPDLSREESRAILDGLPEPARSQAQSWEYVSLLLGTAMPLFEQVQPFRQLAQAMGLDAGWLRDSGGGPDWLPQFPRLLDEQAAADGPLPNPDQAIDSALANLRHASSRPPRSADAISLALQPLFEATTFVPPESFNRAAAELAQTAATADPAWAGELARTSGGFIERGATSEPGADALIAGLPRLLEPTIAFVEECRTRPTEEDASPVDTHAEAVAGEMPEAKRAFDALASYCLGIIAHLARSPAARSRHGQNAGLLDQLNEVRWDTGDTGFLWKMLQVLEGELIVLAPAFKTGWKVKVSGVGDNFQLHALIGGHLVGRLEDGKYPGTVSTHDVKPEPPGGVPLSPRATATQMNAPCTGQEPGFSSRIQLWSWTALQKDGTLPADPVAAHEHFIWNEGVPADILPFDGTRVVLLGESSIDRHWNGGRIFPFMIASFEIVETMTPKSASGWLTRIGTGE